MEAPLDNNPSWAWRSLLEGRKVLEKMLKWQIGRGDNVPIHVASWLFNKYPHYLPLVGRQNNNIFLMKQLIHEDDSWNETLIRAQFSPDIVDEILKEQPSGANDELIWTLTKNGDYSIALGYEISFSFYHPPLESLPLQYAIRKIWSIEKPTIVDTRNGAGMGGRFCSHE